MGNKTLKLIGIPYSSFLKIELPRFALRLLDIVEEHNPEELKIKEIYDLLVAEKPRIANLIDKYGPHPLTEDLRNLRKMRTLYISAVKFQLKVVMREDKSGVNKDVKMVREAIHHFVNNLELSKNEEMYNQKVTHFFEAIAINQALDSAMSSLEFVEHLDNLESVHISIQKGIADKVRSISLRPVETTVELVNYVLAASKNMLKEIELAPLKNTDLDYSLLYNELNTLLTDYRDIINRRVLANKRKAEKTNNENGESTEMTPIIYSTQPAEKMFHLDAEEVKMNEIETEIEEDENAVAMLSKTMQLPLNNGEA